VQADIALPPGLSDTGRLILKGLHSSNAVQNIGIHASIAQISAKKAPAGFARRLLMTTAFIALPAMASADPFFKLNNPGDPNFNQLLGINDGRVIVGYFGDGTVVANNGYVLVPQNHYSVENFTKVPASQTQAIGINNREIPEIVGFYTDAKTTFTHGFLDRESTQVTIDDPMGLKGIKAPVQNLLSVNNKNQASGFWTDNNMNTHGFVVTFLPALSFKEVGPNLFSGAVSDQVTGINDNGQICGFWTDKNMISHGFFGPLGGTLKSFEAALPKVVSTQAFGCNNNGHIVGSFTESEGDIHGFFFNGKTFTKFTAPGESQKTAFGVKGTFINGINNNNDFVGFFSDGTHVNGFVNFAKATGPE
jgi:hypothetical protein